MSQATDAVRACYAGPACDPCRETATTLAQYQVPEHLRDALRRYVVHHQPTGQFLSAVLRNFLMESVGRADAESLAGLRPLTLWIWNEAPSPCHGSPEAVTKWLEGAAAAAGDEG